MTKTEPLLKVQDLKKHYEVKQFLTPSQTVRALDGVTMELFPGETLAVVGESGCGKSTLAKVLMQIEKPTEGQYQLLGKNALDLAPKDFFHLIQMIFQDPYSSINPRKRAWQIIAEPLKVHTPLSNSEAKVRALEMMEKVGLRPELADRYPHMFSGGQRQRIGIARALMLNPKILICDEPVSALDVSIQAQVINLLMNLQNALGLSYIFISHDLSVVKHLADRVMVMYLGKIVEYGNRLAVFQNPLHPYTQALLASTPDIKNLEQKLSVLQGEIPSPINPPSGCAFHKRCPFARENCATEPPVLRKVGEQLVSCHYAENLEQVLLTPTPKNK